MEFLIVILLIMLAIVISKLTNIISEISQQRSQFQELSSLIEKSISTKESIPVPISEQQDINLQSDDSQRSPVANDAEIPEQNNVTPQNPWQYDKTAFIDNVPPQSLEIDTSTHLQQMDLSEESKPSHKDSPINGALSSPSRQQEGKVDSIAIEVEKYIKAKAERLAAESDNQKQLQEIKPEDVLLIAHTKEEEKEAAPIILPSIEQQSDNKETLADIKQDTTSAIEESAWEQDNTVITPEIKSESSLVA